MNVRNVRGKAVTPTEKKEAYRQKCREAERARRDALGLPQHPHEKPKRKQTKTARKRWEDVRDPLDEKDNLGLSQDY